MFYRNDSTVAPYPVQLPGCALDCPLEDFVRITQLSISDDRNMECHLRTENRGNTFNRQLHHNGTKVSQNAWFKCYVFTCRSDHQSSVVWLPAPLPHHPPTWHYLLSQRAGEKPEIPAGDQWRSWGWLLTQVQTPPSKICKSHILGKQRRHWALNHFEDSFDGFINRAVLICRNISRLKEKFTLGPNCQWWTVGVAITVWRLKSRDAFFSFFPPAYFQQD